MTKAFLSLSALLLCANLFGSDVADVWTGYITDTHCGTHCQRTSSMKPDVKCIRLCVKQGSKYGLWSGKNVYVLEPQNEAAQFAAENVQVQGRMVNDVIYVTAIKAVHSLNAPQQKRPPD